MPNFKIWKVAMLVIFLWWMYFNIALVSKFLYNAAESNRGLPTRPNRPRDRENYSAVSSALSNPKPKKILYQSETTSKPPIKMEKSHMDTRPTSCKNIKYPEALPSVTIILVISSQDSYRTLTSTLHSIQENSPSYLVKEILLIDDCSIIDTERLDKYARMNTKIVILRMRKRQGLVKARLRAVQMAKGDIVVFLDAQSLCKKGWLEPLLHIIWGNRRTIAFPASDNPMATRGVQKRPRKETNVVLGTVDWTLTIREKKIWINESRMLVNQGKETEPNDPPAATTWQSPAIFGNTFAINTMFLNQLDLFHPELTADEANLELSIKTWMCSGSVETTPCSRVGQKNLIATERHGHGMYQVVDGWFDEFKERAYAANDDLLSFNYDHENTQLAPSAQAIKQLRQSLRCQDFKWYLKYINPDMMK